MNTSITDLTVILDRSGSMQAIRTAMEGALARLVADQAAAPGNLLVSLVRFDDQIEPVFTALPADQVRPIRISPRNTTALLDAAGLTIDSTGQRLAALAEHDRPGAVLIVIVTDGMENASTQFTWSDIQTKINHQRDAYHWQFVFLGSNIDAIATASRIGIAAGDALTFMSDSAGVNDAADAASRGLREKRAHLSACVVGPVPDAFRIADRQKQRRGKKT
jgi:hypothetical protein